jgi:hypothetical protein
MMDVFPKFKVCRNKVLRLDEGDRDGILTQNERAHADKI